MPTPTPLTWRLRVRTPRDDGDLFVVTSLRQNDDANRVYNYLRDAPKHDGLQIDPLTGQVTVGAATLEIIDQCASILIASDGTAIPAPPPAPGNLIVGNALLAPNWGPLDLSAADVTTDYPPPTGKSYDGFPAASPSGLAELWNVYSGAIGGSGWFRHHGVFAAVDGILPSTAYVLRALIVSFPDFQPRGIRLPSPYGDDNFHINEGTGTPHPPLAWKDIPGTSDASSEFHVTVGWDTTIESDANVIYIGAMSIFDATGTPPGGGSPAGTGGAFGSGQGRLVTSYLADLAARWRLLGLKAYLEVSLDGGSTWGAEFSSYIGHVKQADALTYEVTLTDTRRVDLVTQFLQASGLASTAILGTIGATSSDVEAANPTFKVIAVDATAGAVMLAYDSGVLPNSAGYPSGLSVGADGKAAAATDQVFWTAVDQAALAYANTGQGFDWAGGAKYRTAFGLNTQAFLMDGLAVDILDGSGNYQATYTPLGYLAAGQFSGVPLPGSTALSMDPLQPFATAFNGVTVPQGAIVVNWATSQPSVGATVKLRLYAPNAAKVFTATGHPIDLLTRWWTNVGIAYDAAAAAAVRHELGDDLAVVYRFDETSGNQTLYQVTQSAITAPFGVSWRTDDTQQRVLFICRDLSLLTLPSGTFGAAGPLTPVETIGIDDLRAADASAFDLDEQSIKNRVTVTWQLIRAWDATLDGGDRPPDGMVAIPQTPIQVDFSTSGTISLGGTPEPDSDIAGVKEFRIDLPGFVGATVFGAATGTVQAIDMVNWAIATAIGIFSRVGRGAPLVTLQAIRGRSAADVGDIIATTADHVVNTFLDTFPVSQRIREGGGSRLLQVVQRTPTPEGPDLTCWDVGPGTAVGATPAFTLAAASADPYHLAVATLTNATDVLALGAGTQVIVQYAVSATEPTAGLLAGTIDPSSATLALTLPPVNGGSTVWARMAASVPNQGPGTWSAWQSLALTALPDVTGLSAAAAANGTDVLLTWTPGSTVFQEAVYQDGVLIAVLPPGTDHYLVQGVSGSHTYTIKTIDPAPLAGTSTGVSTTGAPTGGVTLTAPIDPAAFAGRQDSATGQIVIDGTFGMEVTATALPSDVVFEVAIETAVGSGTPGTYVPQATIPAVQTGRTRFSAVAPNDGKLRYLRAKSTRNGATSSPYSSPIVSVLPWSQVALPPGTPAVQLNVDGAGNVSITWAGDAFTKSISYAVSTSSQPTDAAALAGTTAGGRSGTTGTLATLAENEVAYVTLFGWTDLGGKGTHSLASWQGHVTFGTGLVDAEYVLVAQDARLPNGRDLEVLAPITKTDGGAGGPLTIGLDTSAGGLGAVALQNVDVDLAFIDDPDGIMLDGVPAAEVDPRYQDARYFDATGFAEARAVATTDVAGASGSKVGFRYSTDGGATWHPLDGVGAPNVAIDAAVAAKSDWVALASGAKADVLFGPTPFGGDGATRPVLTGLALQFRGTTDATRCRLDPAHGEDFEGFADTAALLAAWPQTDPDAYCTFTLDTTTPDTGAKALKLVYAAITAPKADAYVSKTFTGFTPGQAVRVSLRVKGNDANSGGNDHGFKANGVLAKLPTPSSVSDPYQTISADCTADGSGNVVVQIGTFNMSLNDAGGQTFYFDNLTFALDCP